MSKDKLRKIDAAVSRFIQKASKKNEPLEAFRATTHFQDFFDVIESSIMKQAKWLAKHLKDVAYLDDADLTPTEFAAKFGTWLENEMPRINTYVGEDTLFEIMKAAFVYSVESCYGRAGVVLKSADPFVTFDLTNPNYIAALKNQANYLLNKSKMDDTTRSRMINLIRDARLDLTDVNDLAEMLESEFEGISGTRAFLIANTESNQSMSTAQHAFLQENGFQTKVWVAAGPNTCPECDGNAEDGPLPLDEDFSSGDTHPPAHPGCECYEDAGEEIDLDSIPLLWDGS